MPALSIGGLAKTARVGIDTIRFYEKSGLLPAPPRKASGYRQYGEDHLRRLVFIRRAKELGFSLEDIAELLTLRAPKGRGVERVREVARRKLAVVELKIAELERMRDVLGGLVEACPGHGPIDQCPILNAFDPSDRSTPSNSSPE